jgi:hypothetical protein
MIMDKMYSYLKENEGQILADLERIVKAESPSHDQPPDWPAIPVSIDFAHTFESLNPETRRPVRP